MSQYIVNITNGVGSERLPIGVYDVTASVTGYTGLLDPDTFTATGIAGSEDFTIAAEGTLTLVVNETGASGGTPITSGSFIRCNVDGTVTYGTAKTVSAIGECVFDHVPYGTSGSPYTFYVKQLSSDDSHNFDTDPITISMEGDTQTDYVLNTLAALQSFTLVDAYYSGLTVDGSMTFDGPQ